MFLNGEITINDYRSGMSSPEKCSRQHSSSNDLATRRKSGVDDGLTQMVIDAGQKHIGSRVRLFVVFNCH